MPDAELSTARSNAPVIGLLGPSSLDRLAYRELLERHFQLSIAVECGFSAPDVWAALRHQPDLVLVDADHATPDVLDVVTMIPRLRPQTRIIVLSAAVTPAVVEAGGGCPLAGYVVKDGGLEELRRALEAVRSGENYFSAGVRTAIRHGHERQSRRPRLSPRETELLPLLARGMSLRDAAKRMTVSYKTADTYRTSLLRKLGVRDRVELARWAIRERVIDA